MIINSNIKQLPITKVRRELTEVIKKLDKDQVIVLIKNYQPEAVLVSPLWFNQFPSLALVREKIWGRYSENINQALDDLDKTPKKLRPKLLQ